MIQRRILMAYALACMASIPWLPNDARAQEYPDRLIRLIVPNPVGSSDDTVARQVGPALSAALGQSVVIDNKPGAGTTLGATLGARALPDGYTILLGNASGFGAAPSVYKNLQYDPIKDFTPIGRITTIEYVLAVSTKLPVNTVGELIAYARSNPGKLNYASTGIGSGVHLTGARFAQQANIDMQHIPYNAIGALSAGLNTGEVSMMFYPYQPLKPMEQRGDIRILATTGQKRSSFLPRVPTMIESDLRGFVALSWQGLYGPKGMPRQRVDAVYGALEKALADPAIRANMLATATDPSLLPPAAFAAFTQEEIAGFRELAKAANINPQ